MRARTGCQACRDRHIKCVRLSGSERCQKCLENNRSCIQSAPHRFRPVTSVALKTDNDVTVKQSLTYDDSQVWVDIPSSVQFVAARPDPENDQDAQQADGLVEYMPRPDTSASHQDAITGMSPLGRITSTSTHHGNSPSLHRTDSHGVHQIHAYNQRTPTGINYTSPSQHSTHSRSNHLTSPAAALMSIHSPALSYSPSWPFTTVHESRLFFHFIKNITPWVDVCDAQCHFGKEIPRRILQYPILANAIFALAARHISLLTGNEDEESPHFVDQSLQLLITCLEDPLGHWDENLLAAVIILRLHEEIAQDEDQRYHLFGTRRILDSISSFAADGGLRECASWVSLRQHIYISLTNQQPLEISLDNFRHSSVFDDSSDEAWANRIIFIFAKVLDYAFQGGNGNDQEPETHRWSEMEAEVEAWHVSKPWYFSPLWSETKIPASTPQDTQERRFGAWPELLMSHPAQVVGLQYYYLARVVLAIYDPQLSRLSFATHRTRKNSERTVIDGVRMIVGLSASNEDVPNAMFQASHILSACGSYLSNRVEQDAAVTFLGRIQQKMGWRTTKIVEELRSQWYT